MRNGHQAEADETHKSLLVNGEEARDLGLPAEAAHEASKKQVVEKIESVQLSVAERLACMKHLVVYMVPLTVVYFSEYLILSGVGSAMSFKSSWIKEEEQYTAFTIMYQVGLSYILVACAFCTIFCLTMGHGSSILTLSFPYILRSASSYRGAALTLCIPSTYGYFRSFKP